MSSAQDRGWGYLGRPNSPTSKAWAKRNIVRIDGDRWPALWVHRDVAWRFECFLNEITARGYGVEGRVLDDWGYADRYIAGTTRDSNHRHGLAIDVNALTNPQQRTLRTDMPDWVIEAADRWGLFWGGWYRAPTLKDPMHFEFLGTPEQARRWDLIVTPLPINDKLDLPPEVLDVPAKTDCTAQLVTPDGKGRWCLQYDGGIITEGVAPFHGSYPGLRPESRQEHPDRPRGFYIIVPFVRERDGKKISGYTLVATDRSRYDFPA